MAHQPQYLPQSRVPDRLGTTAPIPCQDHYQCHHQGFPTTNTYEPISYNNATHQTTTPINPNMSPGEFTLTQIMDQFIALRLENANLIQTLEEEKKKRKKAEINVLKDKDYINRLENSIQVRTNLFLLSLLPFFILLIE